jgi:hypothetical protein
LVFETFKENSERVESMSSTPDNNNMVLYSADHHLMTLVFRDKITYDSEQVIEDWITVKLN